MTAAATLAALTDAALEHLTSPGLLRRAARDVAEGRAPTLEPLDDRVHATFPDGTRTTAIVGRALSDWPCTCPPAGACRHHLAIVLALRAANPAPVLADPSALTDDDLARALPASARAAAERSLAGSVEVEVRRLPDRVVVLLPTHVVVFLAGAELSAARCDCRLGSGCAHVALAALACRAVPTGDGRAHLGGRRDPSADLSPLIALVHRVVMAGLADDDPGLRDALRRAADDHAALRWPSTLLSQLADALDGWHARRASVDLHALVGLAARARALSFGATPAPLLGTSVPPSDGLGAVRLVGLGARLWPDGDDRQLDVLFASPSHGAIYRLRRRVPPDRPPAFIGGARPHAAAVGELRTTGASASADRRLTLASRAADTQLLRSPAAWDALPAPLRVDDLRHLREVWRAQPPACLAPPLVTARIHALPLGEVRAVGWDAVHQRLLAYAVDARGAPLWLERAWSRAAPDAVGALAQALAAAPVAVVGEVTLRAGRVVMDPWSVALPDDVVCPDLARAAPRADPLRVAPPTDPLDVALDLADDALRRALIDGLRALGASARRRLTEAAERAERCGLADLADALRAAPSSAPAWLDAAIALDLHRHAAALETPEDLATRPTATLQSP